LIVIVSIIIILVRAAKREFNHILKESEDAIALDEELSFPSTYQ